MISLPNPNNDIQPSVLIVNRIDPLYAYKFDPPDEKKETIL